MILRQHSQPQTVGAQALAHHRANIELLALTGCGSVNDYASEWPATAQALCRVLAAQHLEDSVHSFAVRELFHLLLVIHLLVIDAMVKAKLLCATELIVGR